MSFIVLEKKKSTLFVYNINIIFVFVPSFSYTGCPMDGEPGPCQFTGVAEHELFVDSQHVFEDESSITLTGKLPYGDSGCYATDLELHGFATGDKPDAPTYTGAFSEDGSFSMSVQAGTSVTLKFKRDSAPNCERLHLHILFLSFVFFL